MQTGTLQTVIVTTNTSKKLVPQLIPPFAKFDYSKTVFGCSNLYFIHELLKHKCETMLSEVERYQFTLEMNYIRREDVRVYLRRQNIGWLYLICPIINTSY